MKIKKKLFLDKYDDVSIPKLIVWIIIGLFLIITLFLSFTTIKSGEVGLKVRFGKIVDTNLVEGFNFKIPYVEKIVKVNIKVQKTEIDTTSASKDLQDVNTKIAVNYRVKSEEAVNLYKTIGNKYEETILQPAIQEAIKSVVAQYNAEELITKRTEVSTLALETLQEKVQKYGLEIEEFNILNLGFSEEYSNAIEQKQVAEQQLEKSKLEAEAKLVEAQATKEANDLMKQTLTNELLLKEFIEKWNGQLPTTYAGEDILSMFNLN